MINRKYTYKFKYFNSDLNQEIGEIKYLDVGSNAPKEEKYQWYIKTNDTIQLLTFISMETNFRVFKECVLEIINDTCIFNNTMYESIL